MTSFAFDAILILALAVILGAGMYIASKRSGKGVDEAKIYWRGIIALSLIGAILLVFIYNLLERRVDEPPGDAEVPSISGSSSPG